MTWGPGHLFLGERKGKGFCYVDCASSFFGGGHGPCDRSSSYWCLTGKFQTGLLKSCFWERLKLQFDQALNLGLVPWAFSMSDAILGLYIFPLTEIYQIELHVDKCQHLFFGQ